MNESAKAERNTMLNVKYIKNTTIYKSQQNS
jgi:hypothetical protein